MAKKSAKSSAKTKPSRMSVATYIAKQRSPETRADCRALVRLMRKVTGASAKVWAPGMIGFGSYHYRYPSGHEGDCFLTGFKPRQGQLSLYIMAGFAGSAALLRKLGKHKRSVSCLYVKRLADIDLPVLEQLVRRSVREIKRRHPDKK